MPQISVGSTNISTFGFSVTFDVLNRSVLFDTSTLTTYNGSGASLVQGIAFSLEDSDGVVLTSIDFTAPQIPTPATEDTWELDLSSLNFAFLFQRYKIIGSIKDQDGTIYSTTPVYEKICEPVGFTESGYVPGMFQVTADCINNNITVQEITNFSYNDTLPDSKTKSGQFYYPTGTISPISFTNTPFSNNQIFTGENRVVNTTIAKYSLGNEVYVDIAYVTDNTFPVTCSNKMSNVLCCIIDLQTQYQKNCNNAKGLYAKQKLDEVQIPLLAGLLKETNGQDASTESDLIKKTLNCNCGSKSIHQNEPTPINPSVYNIVLNGVGGTTIPSATITGSTKMYNIASNVYQVVKGNTGDLAYTITTDTATSNTVKYKITFNYNVQAGYILTAIAANPTLVTQLNSLINFENFNIDLTALNGGCVIDLSSLNYFLSYKVVSGADAFKSILINGTTYTPSSPIAVSSPNAIETYLNGLGVGTFEVSFSNGSTGAYFSILTTGNANTVTNTTLIVASSDTVVLFQRTNKSLIAVLQAIIDYLCGITSLQIALGNSLQLCYFDYNGNVVYYNYTSGNSQNNFNAGVSSVICNLVNRINTITSVTCSSLRTIFADNALSSFSGGSARLFGIDQNGQCVGFTVNQIGLGVMNSVNTYSNVKAVFCAVDCTAPGTCPDISAINVAVISGNIGVYGVSFATSTAASQTLTVKYRINGTSVWTVATNSLGVFANGNVSGTSPYTISGLTPGTTYDISIVNNCGGEGFIQQITVPTSTVYSGLFLLDAIIYDICGNSSVTLYSNTPFATGVTMYTDNGLTTPVTGYNYIADNSGDIYLINSATGVVGLDTGSNCSTGLGSLYILGNNTGTICLGSSVTLYTNGAFLVGGILYNDSGLTSPVTGYSYVVNSGTIYNLNNSTGVIGASTGLFCGGTFLFRNDGPSGTIQIDDVTPAVYLIDFGAFPINVGDIATGVHGGFTSALSVDLSGFTVACKVELFKNGVSQECLAVGANGTYTFASITIANTDTFEIAVLNGSCS